MQVIFAVTASYGCWNQGATCAVGSPLMLTAGTGTMACRNIKATAPATVAGGVSPGTLNSATATLDLASLTLKDLNINVSIGSTLTRRHRVTSRL